MNQIKLNQIKLSQIKLSSIELNSINVSRHRQGKSRPEPETSQSNQIKLSSIEYFFIDNTIIILTLNIPIGTNTLKLYTKYYLCNMHNFQQLKRDFQQPANVGISAQNTKMRCNALLSL